MAWFVALAALVVALPFVAEWLRQPMTPALEAKAPGAFADLTTGRTHYRWTGREGAPVAVCVHGLSTPSYVFAGTERALTNLGFRVLVYDLHGRGYSARVSGAQTLDFHLAQLRALLAHEAAPVPFVLVGYSMGGAIAAAFAAEEPESVSDLVLIAPAGLVPVYDDWRARLWTLPVLGDWLVRVVGGVQLRRELREHQSTATIIPDFEDRQAAETRMRGYLPAVLSSRRHTLNATLDGAHLEVAARSIPVLAVWGADDAVIPRRAMSRLAELNPDAHHEEVPEAGHNVLQSHPAQVAEALRKFLT